MQNDELTQLTPRNSSSVVGFGDVTPAHVAPFHLSASVAATVPALEENPPAMQNVVLVQLSALRRSPSVPTFGELTMVHPVVAARATSDADGNHASADSSSAPVTVMQSLAPLR